MNISNQGIDNKILAQRSEFKERKNDKQINPQRKSQHFRNELRKNQISNIMKGVRFEWNVQQTIQYLKSIQYQQVDSQEILIQAIQKQKIEYLVELIVSADPLFKVSVLSQQRPIMRLIENKSDSASSILLLGNLCALYQQFIWLVMDKQLLPKLFQAACEIKKNIKSCEIYSWAFTQICRQPSLLHSDQIQICTQQLYILMLQICSKSEKNRHFATHLYRILSYFSIGITFKDEFMDFIMSFRPQREVDVFNLYLALENQIKKFSYSENTSLRIKIVDLIMWLHPRMTKINPKLTKKSVYNNFTTLILKSEYSVSSYIAQKYFQQLIGQYQYGNTKYLLFLKEVLLKLQKKNVMDTLSDFKVNGIIENLINDITDHNVQFGYICLSIMKNVIEQTLSSGQIEYAEWVLSLGLQQEAQQFIENVNQNSEMFKQAQRLLEMISRQQS